MSPFATQDVCKERINGALALRRLPPQGANVDLAVMPQKPSRFSTM